MSISPLDLEYLEKNYSEMDNFGVQINGRCYKRIDGKWTIDGDWQAREDEWQRQLANEESHKAELYWALRSRILTDEEIAEVARYGDSLVRTSKRSSSLDEREKRLNEALLQQFRLRAVLNSQKSQQD